MLEWLSIWGLFSAKALTVVLLILILLIFVVGIMSRARGGGEPSDDGYLTVRSLNDVYEDYDDLIMDSVLSEPERKARENAEKRKRKAEKKSRGKILKSQRSKGGEATIEREKTAFVIDFEGDVEASSVEDLRRLVTVIVRNAEPGDEVILRLDSPGGSVTGYGLCAAQLERIRKAGITLVICVDQVAASGGYMMAVVANRILAAPFAMLGSIGVVTEIPNVHKLLQKNNVDYDVYTAGVHKRPVSIMGENTAEGIEKLKDDLAIIHGSFKEHVLEYRRNLDIETVGSGDVWLGEKAMALGLIDEIKTSDDYLLGLAANAKLLELKFVTPKSLGERLGINAATAAKALSRSVRSSVQRISISR